MSFGWKIATAVELLFAACGGNTPPKPPPPVTKFVTNDLDVLFVIDNSASMDEKQALLGMNFPNFVAALDAFPTGRPNLHIGVVTSTVGTGSDISFGACPKVAPDDDGLLVNLPRVNTGCAPPNGRFISDIASGAARTVNYTGTLDQVFTCIATVGSTGCGFEAQLEGMKRALDGSRPENAGFVRPSAELAIIVLTDEDDCSTEDPAFYSAPDGGPLSLRCIALGYVCDQGTISTTMPGTFTNCTPDPKSLLRSPDDYVAFLSTVKDPGQVMAAVIGGDPKTTITLANEPFPPGELVMEPACTTTIGGGMGVADSGIRLDAFVKALGDHGMYQSICQSDYSASLVAIAKLAAYQMGPCLDGAIDPTDTDSATPGIQLGRCTATNGQPLAACAMLDDHTPDPAGPMPCIWYEADATCTTAPGIAARVAGPTRDYQVTCPVM